MKKPQLAVILCLVLILLTACNDDITDTENNIKEENFQIEDVRFEKQRIFIDTEQETLVYHPSDVSFSKTKDTPYINIKTVEEIYYLGLIPNAKKTKNVIHVYIHEDSVKDISKKYAQEFNKTLSFIESSDD